MAFAEEEGLGKTTILGKENVRGGMHGYFLNIWGWALIPRQAILNRGGGQI